MATQLENYYEELSKLEYPKSTFDAKFYLSNNPDVARDRYFGARPVEHYNIHGKNEGRSPNKETEDLKGGVTAPKINELRQKIQQEETQTSNARQISSLAGGRTDPALLALSGQRNYGASPLAAKVNFQVSDDQILNDYNTAKVDRYKRVVELGNTQAVGIQERLVSAVLT